MTETGAPVRAEQIQSLLLNRTTVRLAPGTTAHTDEEGNANLTLVVESGVSGVYRLHIGSRRTIEAGGEIPCPFLHVAQAPFP